ncbi:MAG: hypothetical protein ACYCZ6_15745 [Polaromonas sp.]
MTKNKKLELTWIDKTSGCGWSRAFSGGLQAQLPRQAADDGGGDGDVWGLAGN